MYVVKHMVNKYTMKIQGFERKLINKQTKKKADFQGRGKGMIIRYNNIIREIS